MPIKPPTFGAKTNRERNRDYDTLTRKHNPALALAAKIRNSGQWRRCRELQLSNHPLCADPYRRCGITPATTVHHIVGLVKRTDLAFTESNLASLCKTCHMQIEQDERNGKNTEGLFR